MLYYVIIYRNYTLLIMICFLAHPVFFAADVVHSMLTLWINLVNVIV